MVSAGNSTDQKVLRHQSEGLQQDVKEGDRTSLKTTLFELVVDLAKRLSKKRWSSPFGIKEDKADKKAIAEKSNLLGRVCWGSGIKEESAPCSKIYLVFHDLLDVFK